MVIDYGGDNDDHGGDNDDHGGYRTKDIPGNCHMEMMMMMLEMMRLSAMPSTMGMRSFMNKFQAITIVMVFTSGGNLLKIQLPSDHD